MATQASTAYSSVWALSSESRGFGHSSKLKKDVDRLAIVSKHTYNTKHTTTAYIND